MNGRKRTIEVWFTPVEFKYRTRNENMIVVVVDILRATTSMCVALASGAEKIIPVAGLEEAKDYKSKGFLIAGERGGVKLDFADFGNSPFELKNAGLNNQTLVFTTTNGTKAIQMAKEAGTVILGAFSNLKVLSDWLGYRSENIGILCAGWENTFSLEDAVFAGCLSNELFSFQDCYFHNDSALAASELWRLYSADWQTRLKQGRHYQRLEKIGEKASLDFAFTMDTTPVIPFLKEDYLINILKNEKTV